MKSILLRSFQTTDAWGPLVARLGLALVMFPHGAQKVLGWFGGPGFGPMLKLFTDMLHIPAPLALLAFAAEFLAPITLALGLFSRLSALSIGITMIVAAKVNLPNGFFMNWFGQQKGEGIEFFILMVALAVVTIIEGAGRWSLDQPIARRLANS